MEGKKAFLGVLLVLVMFSLISAACLAQDEDEESNEDKLFDDWVTEGSSFQVSGLDVFVSAGDSGGQGILIFPQKTLVLGAGNCGMIDRLKVCITEWEYLIGGAVKIHGDDKQKYYVVITIPAPKVSITRDPAERDLEVGQETRVTVTLLNDGTEPALSMVYTETIPPEFDITMTNNIDQQYNKLVWTGAIPPGEEKKLAYNIRAKKTFAGEIPAKLQYKVHDVEKTFYDNMHIEAASLINIGQRRDKRELQYGDEDRFYITLENRRGEDASVELTVNVPKALYVVATQVNTTSNENALLWKGDIGGGEEVELITRVRADDAGPWRINITAKSYFADGKIDVAQEYIDMNVSIKNAELYFIPKKIKKGEESTVKVYLKNPNTLAEFRDIDVSASSNHFNGTIHLEKYKPLGYNEVLAFKVKPDETGKFKAKAEISYKVGTKKFTAKKEEQIEVIEEAPPEEKPPVEENPPAEENMTQAGNETSETPKNKTSIQWNIPESPLKELYFVDYAGWKLGTIKESFARMLDIRKAVSGEISKKAAKEKK